MIRPQFIPTDVQRILMALNRVELTVRREADRLPRRASQKFAINLIEAIAGQKYAGNWASLSERYAKWKAENGLSPNIWQASGDLIHAIRSQPAKKSGTRKSFAYLAGISASAIDSGGKNWSRKGPRKNIAWYGRMLEYGRPASGGKFGGPQPARPLFGPEFELFRGRTFHGYLLQPKRIIIGAWR